jgi:hypothetical protein
MMSWVTFMLAHAFEVGFLGSFVFSLLAIILYLMINLCHTWRHYTRIIP